MDTYMSAVAFFLHKKITSIFKRLNVLSRLSVSFTLPNLFDGIQFGATEESPLQRWTRSKHSKHPCNSSFEFSMRMFRQLFSIVAILLHFGGELEILTVAVAKDGFRSNSKKDFAEKLCLSSFLSSGMQGAFMGNFPQVYKDSMHFSCKKKLRKLPHFPSNTYHSHVSHFNVMNPIVVKAPTRLYMSTDDERLRVLQDLSRSQAPVLEDPSWNPSLPLLEIKDLHVETEDDNQKILDGVSLKIFRGEKHAIMGRNGSGKSTLSKIIAGHPSYRVTSGTMTYKGTNLLTMPVDYRSIAGIFLAFQYPVEIPIVKNSEFLRVAINEHRRWRNETEIDPLEFNVMMYEKLQLVGLTDDFIERPLNYGFSGGEKKRNEILQLLMLQPTLCLLDETDSGLDVDSFKLTAEAVKNYGSKENSFLIVTHYKKLLDLLEPDYIHIMHRGKIVMTGNMTIAAQLEHSGFAQFLDE
ncbi:iron-sulfur assembly ATPase [Cardiosporidium cionae]|uniref:Iron-sulfur assembly ATPase n=1 Tax=Cardiosporidium cionae TaxID=476202 RepID=A0ABQ7JCV7_9APIC|nr:iron-sulfur assembly ATPase [Cardiosporidium cionae]|eukprot:KAF8821833.1 iron-sulfur assembly ATPase [Cardiosporidium cionae]